MLKVTPSIPTPPAFTAAQQALSTQMIGLWTQFAKTGTPNPAGSTLWPQYSTATDTALLLDPAGVRTTTDFAARHRCQFWSGSCGMLAPRGGAAAFCQPTSSAVPVL